VVSSGSSHSALSRPAAFVPQPSGASVIACRTASPMVLPVHVENAPAARFVRPGLVRRNQVRDYLDVTALADRYGIAHAANVLRHIDAYYSDQPGPESEGVATQLARQLADPKPADARNIGRLAGTRFWMHAGRTGER
jgi:hypothetical protein